MTPPVAPASDGTPEAVQAHPHTSKDTTMTITPDRLAEIRQRHSRASTLAESLPSVIEDWENGDGFVSGPEVLNLFCETRMGKDAGEFTFALHSWKDVRDLLAELDCLRAQRDRLLALHEYDELIFGGFICVHCTPDDADDADDADDNVPWPCPSLRAVGVDNDEGNTIILARRDAIARKAAQEAGAQ